MSYLFSSLQNTFLLRVPAYWQVQQKNNNEIDNYKALCFSSKRNNNMHIVVGELNGNSGKLFYPTATLMLTL